VTDSKKDSGIISAVTSASLALDKKQQNLIPQAMDPGNAEVLDDSLLQALHDIECRLRGFSLNSPAEESKSLARDMKRLIGKLNAEPDIPLNFRRQVLRRFEKSLDLFDTEMASAVLNAHKIAIMQLLQTAREDKRYRPILLEMISNALEIAIKRLLIKLEQYRTPSIIITRQFFDLARIGLDISAAEGDTTPAETTRLNRMVCNYEMLRKLNFFGKAHSLQKAIWQELQHYIGILKPRLYHSGDTFPNSSDNILMFINLHKPNDPGRIVDHLPETIEYDCIVIPLAPFIQRIREALQKTENVLHHQHLQEKNLHTERSLENTLIGCKAILDALKSEKRAPRQTQTGIRVQLGLDPSIAILKAFTPTRRNKTGSTSELFNQARAWNVVDLNQHGICLERMHAQAITVLPDSLVGLQWYFGDDQLEFKFIPWKDGMDQENPEAPRLGFIRWVRENRSGEQRIGIEFFDAHHKLSKAALAQGQREVDDRPALPVLVKPGKTMHTTTVPGTKVYKDMTFMIVHGHQRAHFKIREITHTGQNYTRCEIVRARQS